MVLRGNNGHKLHKPMVLRGNNGHNLHNLRVLRGNNGHIHPYTHTQGGIYGHIPPYVHTQGGYIRAYTTLCTPRKATYGHIHHPMYTQERYTGIYTTVIYPGEVYGHVHHCIYTPREVYQHIHHPEVYLRRETLCAEYSPPSLGRLGTLRRVLSSLLRNVGNEAKSALSPPLGTWVTRRRVLSPSVVIPVSLLD